MTGRRQPANTRAPNLNTIDEVPDSSWFTNRPRQSSLLRIWRADRTPARSRARALEKLLREIDGTSPGFTARDANNRTWFLPIDPPEYPGASTADVEIATKIWGLGYNQVETFITTFDPRHVDIDPKATVRRPVGRANPFTRTT